MAKKPETSKKRPVEQYDHKAKTRPNNPSVGLVDTKSDAGALTNKAFSRVLIGGEATVLSPASNVSSLIAHQNAKSNTLEGVQ